MHALKIICCIFLIFSTMFSFGCKGMGAAVGKGVVKGVTKTVARGASKLVVKTTTSIVNGAFTFVGKTAAKVVYFAKEEVEDKIIDELIDVANSNISSKLNQIYAETMNSDITKTVTEHADKAITFVKAEISDELSDKVRDSFESSVTVADKINKVHEKNENYLTVADKLNKIQDKTIGSSITKKLLKGSHSIKQLNIAPHVLDSLTKYGEKVR